MVGTRGFEPPASCTPCKRSTRLNYVPLCEQNSIIILVQAASGFLSCFVKLVFTKTRQLRFTFHQHTQFIIYCKYFFILLVIVIKYLLLEWLCVTHFSTYNQ